MLLSVPLTMVSALHDKASAALIALAGAIAFVVWYRSRSEAERASVTGMTSNEDSGTSGQNSAAPEGLTGEKAHPGWNAQAFAALTKFAEEHGLKRTSHDYPGEHAGHVPGSRHYIGEAIDVAASVSLETIKRWAAAAGFQVLDERYTGEGRYGYSSGPHYHIQVPG